MDVSNKYKFDYAEFKIYFRKYLIWKYALPLIINLILIIGMLSVVLYYNLPTYTYLVPMPFYLYIIILIVQAIRKFTRAKIANKNDYISIIKNSESLIDIQMHILGDIYNEFFYINKITSLTRRQSICIKGDITREYVYLKHSGYKGVESIKKLKIPAYFENMDEIHASLIIFKEQTADKQ